MPGLSAQCGAGLRLEFLSSPPNYFRVFLPSRNPVRQRLMGLTIQHLLEIQEIELVPLAEQGLGFYFNLFVVPKSSGGVRVESDPRAEAPECLSHLQTIQNIFLEVHSARDQAVGSSSVRRLHRGVLAHPNPPISL